MSETGTKCCPPERYESENATDSQAGTGTNCPDVTVSITPPSGALVFFPTYIVLTADHPDAVIRYTVDGTEPNALSTLYSVPFQITGIGTVVHARAFLADCSPGPVAVAVYQNPPFPIGLAYLCDTPDHGGSFGEFVPNGTVDNHWQLRFILSALTTIKRLELYQMNGAGIWDTGIVWSTDSPITDINGGSRAVMPLLLFIAAVQQHVTYQSSLGAFGAATHTWDLYGDQWQPASGFFRLDMILADNTRITSIATDDTCTGGPPTPCSSPAAPTVTPMCDGAVEVTFVGAPPQNYKIWVSQVGSPGGWTLAASGAMAVSPETVGISGLIKGALYYFRVELDYGAPCGYQSSIPVPAVPLNDPFVTITSDKLEVDPGESFTISWNSQYIGGAVCGGCLDGQVSLDQGLGCKAGNVTGSQATSQAVAGEYTYTITGCNTCGTETASVVVVVRDSAECETRPEKLHIANPTTLMCGHITVEDCGLLILDASFPVWNGEIPQVGIDCSWIAGQEGDVRGLCSLPELGHDGYPIFNVVVILSAGRWTLTFVNHLNFNFIWVGEKLFGDSPIGTYTRTSGCATGPATITVS